MTQNGNDKLKEYSAEQIQVLEGLEAVRKRPAMYIGSTSFRGLHHCVYEVVDNAIDEVMAGFCKNINVSINADGSLTVEDDGRGIPVDMHPTQKKPALEVVMTMLHAGGKFGSGSYKVSGGLHGVGVSVVNALSEWLEAEISRDGKIYFQRYERGKTKDKLKVIGNSKNTGTKVTYYPDIKIFHEGIEFVFDEIARRLQELAYLNKEVKIKLTDLRTQPKTIKEFYEKGGIVSLVKHINVNKDVLFNTPIYFTKNKDDVDIEVALQYNDGYNDTILSFVNNIPTIEGGTHLSGFKTALTRIINNYLKKNPPTQKDKDANLSGYDVQEGIVAVISAKIFNPQFEGQTKTKLGNSEVYGIVNSAVGEALAEYFEENPPIARKVIEKGLAASRARESAKKALDLARKQNAFEGGILPGKLAGCSEKDPEKCELYIVEGDSAGGSAKQGRDRKYQAILPLRGKILNVEKTRLDKVLSNEEIRSLIMALGTGFSTKKDGEETDIEWDKLRYHKIIIMTDADVDGAHIRVLLLTFFFRYFRPLIEQEKIYIAQPPLYLLKVSGISKEKKKSEDESEGEELQSQMYLYSDRELEKALKKTGNKKYTIQRYKGLGEMNPEQLWNTTMNKDTRTILKVTLEDVALAEETFTILMGSKVEPRKEFIQNHAHKVKNLDV